MAERIPVRGRWCDRLQENVMGKIVTDDKGLTLVEVMIALAISSLIAGLAWDLFQGSWHGYRRGLQEVALTQEARSVLSIMTRDLQRALTTTESYGFQGARPGSIALLDRRQQMGRLMITAVAPPAMDMAEAPPPGSVRLQRIRYFLEPASTDPQRSPMRGVLARLRWRQRASVPQGRLVLKRAVAPLGPESVERVISLSERLRQLDLRYFDGQAWSEEWRRSDRPRAIEIAIVLQDGGPESNPHRFATTVALE